MEARTSAPQLKVAHFPKRAKEKWWSYQEDFVTIDLLRGANKSMGETI